MMGSGDGIGRGLSGAASDGGNDPRIKANGAHAGRAVHVGGHDEPGGRNLTLQGWVHWGIGFASGCGWVWVCGRVG